MEFVEDLEVNNENSKLVKKVLESFIRAIFAEMELENDDLHSRKHHKRKRATDEQHANLLIVTETAWDNLNKSLSIDLSFVLHALLNQQKQDALKVAIIQNRTLTRDFVRKFIPVFWVKFVDQRKLQEKRDEQKRKREEQKAKQEREKAMGEHEKEMMSNAEQ